MIPQIGPTSRPVPAGGGGDFGAIAMEGIDLSADGWTLYDPDSLLDNVAVAGGVHTFTMNELLAGSTNYAWSTGSAHRGPRWHRPLLDANGVRVTSDDMWIMRVDLAWSAPTLQFASEVAVGVALDPTSTVPTTIGGTGNIQQAFATGSPSYGVWTINSATTGGTGGTVSGTTITWLMNKGVGSPSGLAFDSTPARTNSLSRNANINYGSGVDLFLMVGLGTRGSAAIADGADVRCTMATRLLKFSA